MQDSVVIMDKDTDATRALVSARAQAIPDFSVNETYQAFYDKHAQDYVRVHVHLVGVISTQSHQHGAVGKRRNRFGKPRVVDTLADPYVKVALQNPAGSTDHFDLASHQFPTLLNCRTPLWDSKCLLICQKQALQDGLKLTLMDANENRPDEVLMEVTVGGEDLPSPTPLRASEWKHYELQDTTTSQRIQHAAMEFSIMVTETSDRMVSAEDLQAVMMTEATSRDDEEDRHVYVEHVLKHEAMEDEETSPGNAVLQSWTHPASTKACLWVLGRNDCFMHPHVAQALFWSQGYDLYVVNYKMNGACRKLGFVGDPHFNSHNPTGNFDSYLEDIDQSLAIISGDKDYDSVLGYAHSTGGPVLLNYLMEKGDDAFDGFLFNSPFLDWGFVGGDLVELVLENTHLLEYVGAMKADSKVGVASTPPETTPLTYLGQEIVLCDWSARLWSMYYFDWATRPLYKVPMTVGFAKGVTAVHRKLESFHKRRQAVTAKPFLCITSRGDDVLKAPETLSRADWIGPARWEIELNDNGHDVFLSYDAMDTDMAIQMCLTWMKNRRFA